MSDNNCLELRAHHILCCAAFEGKGYTKEFIKKLSSIQNAILTNIKIKLITTADHVCGSCPNILSSGCASQNSPVNRMDKSVLAFLNIDETKTMPSKNIYELLSDVDKAKLNTVCLNCEWKKNSICKISNYKIRQFMNKIDIC